MLSSLKSNAGSSPTVKAVTNRGNSAEIWAGWFHPRPSSWRAQRGFAQAAGRRWRLLAQVCASLVS